MPRSFLVCRRTPNGCGWTRSDEKSCRQRQPLDEELSCSSEKLETNAETVDKSWSPWQPTSIEVTGKKSQTENKAERPDSSADRDKTQPSLIPPSTATVFRWNYDSDDEIGNGNLPMALFGNEGIVLPTLTSDKCRLQSLGHHGDDADMSDDGGGQTILDLSPRNNTSTFAVDATYGDHVGSSAVVSLSTSSLGWYGSLRTITTGSLSPPSFGSRSPALATSDSRFHLLADFIEGRSVACRSPSSSSSSSSSSSGFGGSDLAPSGSSTSAATTSDASSDGWTSMISVNVLSASSRIECSTADEFIRDPIGDCQPIGRLVPDIDETSPPCRAAVEPPAKTSEAVLQLADGRYRRRHSRASSLSSSGSRIDDVVRPPSSSSRDAGVSRGGGGAVEQRFACDECDRRYATSSNLSRHKQTHRSVDGEHARPCPHCRKLYVSMPALSMHLLTHDLKYRCSVCDKSFSRPWLLRGHERSHTGERPFSCTQCGKAFADRSNLRAHVQTHSAAKQFSCPRCSKTFALKSYLMKHCELACGQEQ